MKPINLYYQRAINATQHASGLAPLLLRLFLAPIFMQAGYNKLAHFESTVAWFGNAQGGLGLPFPEAMVLLAGGTELIGGALLIPGIAVRLFAIPLMITMLVAIVSVHWEHGWLAISDANSWLANDRVLAAAEQRSKIISLLQAHGNYSWLTQHGSVTVLNNGIEFAVTYGLMLFSLFITGAGKYTSVDDAIRHYVHKTP